MRQTVTVPQAVIDEHSLVAQVYAGYLVGHPVRAARYTVPIATPGAVDIDWKSPWKEPNPVQDDCAFCLRLTDDEAVRRVAGFQAAIDKEVLGTKYKHLSEWATERGLDSTDHAVRRQFIAENQYVPRPEHISDYGTPRPAAPNGWKTKAAPIVDLPLRLKRKLCIDWNHVYMRWLASMDNLHYDFETREFYRDLDVSQEFYDEFVNGADDSGAFCWPGSIGHV
jgi:hypothetical protein